jgi:hypothetical protein
MIALGEMPLNDGLPSIVVLVEQHFFSRNYIG